MTALRFNRSGALLASGSQDTDVIVWDVVAEAGLFRLRAHTGQITDLVLRGAFCTKCLSPSGAPCVYRLGVGMHVDRADAAVRAECTH